MLFGSVICLVFVCLLCRVSSWIKWANLQIGIGKTMQLGLQGEIEGICEVDEADMMLGNGTRFRERDIVDPLDEDREERSSESGGFGGWKNHLLGGITQRVKSWYWGRPLVSPCLFYFSLILLYFDFPLLTFTLLPPRTGPYGTYSSFSENILFFQHISKSALGIASRWFCVRLTRYYACNFILFCIFNKIYLLNYSALAHYVSRAFFSFSVKLFIKLFSFSIVIHFARYKKLLFNKEAHSLCLENVDDEECFH